MDLFFFLSVFLGVFTVSKAATLYEELSLLNATKLLSLVDKAGLSSVLKTGGKKYITLGVA